MSVNKLKTKKNKRNNNMHYISNKCSSNNINDPQNFDFPKKAKVKRPLFKPKSNNCATTVNKGNEERNVNSKTKIFSARNKIVNQQIIQNRPKKRTNFVKNHANMPTYVSKQRNRPVNKLNNEYHKKRKSNKSNVNFSLCTDPEVTQTNIELGGENFPKSVDVVFRTSANSKPSCGKNQWSYNNQNNDVSIADNAEEKEINIKGNTNSAQEHHFLAQKRENQSNCNRDVGEKSSTEQLDDCCTRTKIKMRIHKADLESNNQLIEVFLGGRRSTSSLLNDESKKHTHAIFNLTHRSKSFKKSTRFKMELENNSAQKHEALGGTVIDGKNSFSDIKNEISKENYSTPGEQIQVAKKSSSTILEISKKLKVKSMHCKVLEESIGNTDVRILRQGHPELKTTLAFEQGYRNVRILFNNISQDEEKRNTDKVDTHPSETKVMQMNQEIQTTEIFSAKSNNDTKKECSNEHKSKEESEIEKNEDFEQQVTHYVQESKENKTSELKSIKSQRIEGFDKCEEIPMLNVEGKQITHMNDRKCGTFKITENGIITEMNSETIEKTDKELNFELSENLAEKIEIKSSVDKDKHSNELFLLSRPNDAVKTKEQKMSNHELENERSRTIHQIHDIKMEEIVFENFPAKKISDEDATQCRTIQGENQQSLVSDYSLTCALSSTESDHSSVPVLHRAISSTERNEFSSVNILRLYAPFESNHLEHSIPRWFIDIINPETGAGDINEPHTPYTVETIEDNGQAHSNQHLNYDVRGDEEAGGDLTAHLIFSTTITEDELSINASNEIEENERIDHVNNISTHMNIHEIDEEISNKCWESKNNIQSSVNECDHKVEKKELEEVNETVNLFINVKSKETQKTESKQSVPKNYITSPNRPKISIRSSAASKFSKSRHSLHISKPEIISDMFVEESMKEDDQTNENSEENNKVGDPLKEYRKEKCGVKCEKKIVGEVITPVVENYTVQTETAGFLACAEQTIAQRLEENEKSLGQDRQRPSNIEHRINLELTEGITSYREITESKLERTNKRTDSVEIKSIQLSKTIENFYKTLTRKNIDNTNRFERSKSITKLENLNRKQFLRYDKPSKKKSCKSKSQNKEISKKKEFQSKPEQLDINIEETLTNNQDKKNESRALFEKEKAKHSKIKGIREVEKNIICRNEKRKEIAKTIQKKIDKLKEKSSEVKTNNNERKIRKEVLKESNFSKVEKPKANVLGTQKKKKELLVRKTLINQKLHDPESNKPRQMCHYMRNYVDLVIKDISNMD